MPNYVRNILTINSGTDAELNEVLDFVSDKETGNVFDFNRIIPMPSELNIDCKSIGEISLMHMLSECLDDYKFLIDKDIITKYWGEISDNDRVESIELGKKYLINIAKYGYPNCYGWRKKNWGCKWNAMDCNVEGNTITFSTPWCSPHYIFNKLSEVFPKIVFSVKYADEDMGANCGIASYEEGICIKSVIPKCLSNEAYKLSFEIWPEYENLYEFKNGEYVHK